MPRRKPRRKHKSKKGKASTAKEDASEEAISIENRSTGDASNEEEPKESEPKENELKENEPKENEPKENEPDEWTSATKKRIDALVSLNVLSDKMLELSLQEFSKKPQPNGFYNRWKLTLRWGFCAAPFCLEREGLLVCNACKAAAYCCRDHQIKSYHLHKEGCLNIKNALEAMAEEEAKLRAHPGDDRLPANPFETVRGRFSLYEATSPYLDRRCEVIDALSEVHDGIAVEAMLYHCLEVLKLDNMDQRGEGFDWSNISAQQFPGFHDEDVFESVNVFLNNPIILSHLIFMTQLKCKIFIDLRMLQYKAEKHGSPSASYETKMGWVRECAISDILYRRRDIVERDGWGDLIKALASQVPKLHTQVKKRNPQYWPALKDPEKWFATPPEDEYNPGPSEETATEFRLTWNS
ncbi:hypothetical protein F5Y00DRAFT_271176 [Daldinia vernicosa]|uniref:uncharacterized protein n=1 Tax=Daldinia vernicosa TaxID=114800 RepID=UPI0020081092|nr:uncharacterized protein F5Y00DRAFT_271176 [Daldinia vernicosa]KAI0847439.1 hypothetical protein F5Y00DRAFT_271176 [Daldinia vernicosa]